MNDAPTRTLDEIIDGLRDGLTRVREKRDRVEADRPRLERERDRLRRENERLRTQLDAARGLPASAAVLEGRADDPLASGGGNPLPPVAATAGGPFRR